MKTEEEVKLMIARIEGCIDVIEKTAWYFVVIAGLAACYALFRRRSH